MKKTTALPYLVVSLVAGLGGGAVFLSAGQALAEEHNVAVLGIEAGDGVPEAVATAVTDALRQRMSLTPGYRLVQGRDLVEVKLVFSCPDEAPPCMAQAAKSLGASRLLFGSLQKAGGDAFNLTIKFFDSQKEVVESWTSDQFDRSQASAASLRGPAQKWIATLTGQSLPGTLRIQGNVLGAQVSLDNVGMGVIGPTGLGISGVAAGKHEIVVEKPGYLPAKKTITLGSGESRDVTFEMVPESRPGAVEGAATTAAEAGPVTTIEPLPYPETPSSSSDRRIGTKVAAWLTLAGGLAGIVVGVRYSLLINKANNNLDKYRRFDCVPQNIDLGYGCDNRNVPAKEALSPEEWQWMQDTKDSAQRYESYQWIGYGVGGALLATSAVLFYRGYVSSSSSTSVADARGTSLQLAPLIAPNTVGAAAFTTF